MLKDISANDETISMSTLDSYINALERLFVIEDIDAWCPAIRSATVIRSGKKREFIDPSGIESIHGETINRACRK